MKINLETLIHAPVQICFDLSRSIDLHSESMTHSGERAVGGVTSGLIGLDQEVTWEAKHFGLKWTATSRITTMEPPYFFVDAMTEGPFLLFRHEHRFEPENGQTKMTDDIEVRTHFGPPGDLVAAAYLKRLMRVRNDLIRQKAEQQIGA